MAVVGTPASGGSAAVVLTGRVDILSVGELRELLIEAVDAGLGDLVVDVAGLAFVDAAGLGVLLATHRRCRRAGRRLVLRRPPAELVRLLHRTRLSRVIATDDGVAETGGDPAAARPAG